MKYRCFILMLATLFVVVLTGCSGVSSMTADHSGTYGSEREWSYSILPAINEGSWIAWFWGFAIITGMFYILGRTDTYLGDYHLVHSHNSGKWYSWVDYTNMSKVADGSIERGDKCLTFIYLVGLFGVEMYFFTHYLDIRNALLLILLAIAVIVECYFIAPIIRPICKAVSYVSWWLLATDNILGLLMYLVNTNWR